MAKQLSSFEKAFAAARKDKQKEFTWNKKKYTTEGKMKRTLKRGLKDLKSLKRKQ